MLFLKVLILNTSDISTPVKSRVLYILKPYSYLIYKSLHRFHWLQYIFIPFFFCFNENKYVIFATKSQWWTGMIFNCVKFSTSEWVNYKIEQLQKYYGIKWVVMHIFRHSILWHDQNFVPQSKTFYDTCCCKVVKIIYDVEKYFK